MQVTSSRQIRYWLDTDFCFSCKYIFITSSGNIDVWTYQFKFDHDLLNQTTRRSDSIIAHTMRPEVKINT